MSTSESENMHLFNVSTWAPQSSNESTTNLSTTEIVLTILMEVENRVRNLLQDVCLNSTFPIKYDISSPKSGAPYLYFLTTISTPYKFSLEAFPRIGKPSQEEMTKGSEALKFHEIFEAAIERYTGSRAKPNAVLQETRSTDFCYPVTINIEAVPHEKAKKPFRLLLLREFQILVTIWEHYRNELRHQKCNIDQMIGFPMPFEFCSVSGSDLDLPTKSFESYNYYNINGALVDIKKDFKMPLSTSTTLNSTLSYMSMEKLGPSVTYLMDVLRSHSKLFSLSSALMVYDQLLCRLVVMHRYSVVHGDLNTDCLRFGSGNACNVLYISDFSTGIVVPCKDTPKFLFHDRFASTQRVKGKIHHFVQDLESAYYIFLLLAIGCLPWDGKVKVDNRISQTLLAGHVSKDSNPMTDQSTTLKDKENFWDSTSLVQRLVNSREFELDGGLYHNFIKDLIMAIHIKMKDILSKCSGCSHESFMRDINIHGTGANKAYLGLRKSIASYFRFEKLNPLLKDPGTDAKIVMLRAQDPKDRRMAWDLSSWCWNGLCVDTKPSNLSAYLQKALVMQTS